MKMDLTTIGVLIIFIGIIIIFVGALSNMGKGESKVAVGGFVGFIPFGFANDKKMLWFVIGLSFFIFVLSLIVRLTWK
jgi:uncharacterized membrane protein